MDDIFWDYALTTALILGKILLLVVPLIVGIAYLTLAERKVIAAMQLRRGPNVVNCR